METLPVIEVEEIQCLGFEMPEALDSLLSMEKYFYWVFARGKDLQAWNKSSRTASD